jgi:hypothetical protein
MRTSLNNLQIIEQYLQGTLSAGDRLVFEARLLINPALRIDLYYQKKTFTLIKMYHRQQLKEELDGLHRKLFNDPTNRDFQQGIDQIFKLRK